MADKLTATPGGPIAPQHVMGRDELIAELWEMLENSSLRLVAERRVGKTNIIRKMAAEPRPGKQVYFWDVSSAQTVGEFAQDVYEHVESELRARKVAMTRARQWLNEIGGAEITGVKLPEIAASHWKTLLEKTTDDLVEHCGKEVVFLWDEMPWMLEKIIQAAPTQPEGERVVMDLLDVLRALRSRHPSLRIVFTGSIGLHHVLSALHAKGYRNRPVNDMPIMEVPPHSIPHAKELALELLRNESIPVDDEDAVAQALAEGVGGFSFYIHYLVADLRKYRYRGETVTTSVIESLIKSSLEDDQDRWELRNYIDRLQNYYGSRASLALDILDEVASVSSPIDLTALLNRLRAQNPGVQKEETRELLELLRSDHYITLHQGKYSFRYKIVGRYWRTHRGLGV